MDWCGSAFDIRSKARILQNCQNGTIMVLALVKLLLKIVKSSYTSPQAIFKDPFRRGENILVICDAYTPAREPIPTNKKHNAAKLFSHPYVAPEEPWGKFLRSLRGTIIEETQRVP